MVKERTSQSTASAVFRLCLLVGTAFALAGLVAARLVSSGAGHKNKAVMIAVAEIHRSGPVLSVLSTNYVDVTRALGSPTLDISSDVVTVSAGATLQGGATNTVLGQDIVLLRFKRDSAEPAFSLMIWPKSELFRRLTSASRNVDGVRVDLWSDPERVYALVRDQPQ